MGGQAACLRGRRNALRNSARRRPLSFKERDPCPRGGGRCKRPPAGGLHTAPAGGACLLLIFSLGPLIVIAIAIWLPDTPIEWRDVWLRPDRSAATDAKSPAAAIEILFMGHVLGIDGSSAVQPGNVPPSCRFRAINGFECSMRLPAGGRSAAAHRPAPPEWGDLHRAAPGNRRERGRVSQPLRTAVGDLLILAQGP
jgi:hypothetical protein